MVYYPLEDLTGLGYTLSLVYLSLDIQHFLALGFTQIVHNLLCIWICGLRGLPIDYTLEVNPFHEVIKLAF